MVSHGKWSLDSYLATSPCQQRRHRSLCVLICRPEGEGSVFSACGRFVIPLLVGQETDQSSDGP